MELKFISHAKLQLKGDENGFIKKSITLPCNGSTICLKVFKITDRRYRFHGVNQTNWFQKKDSNSITAAKSFTIANAEEKSEENGGQFDTICTRSRSVADAIEILGQKAAGDSSSSLETIPRKVNQSLLGVNETCKRDKPETDI